MIRNGEYLGSCISKKENIYEQFEHSRNSFNLCGVYGHNEVRTNRETVRFDEIGTVDIYDNNADLKRIHHVFPFGGAFGEFDVSYPYGIKLVRRLSANQVMDRIVNTMKNHCDSEKHLRNHSLPSFTFNTLDIMYKVVASLTPEQRLSYIDELHDIVTDSRLNPYWKRNKTRNSYYRQDTCNHRTYLLLLVFAQFLAYEIIYGNEEENRALIDYFYNRAYILDLCYGTIEGVAINNKGSADRFYKQIAKVLRNRKDEEYRFFDAPHDTWTSQGECRKGSAVSIAAFLAKRAIRNGFACDMDYEIVDEYKSFVAFVHRTDKVFADTYSIEYDGENGVVIPESAVCLSTKEAKGGLEELAEKTEWNALKYAIYTQLAIISKPREAAKYHKMRLSLAKIEDVPFVVKDLDPSVKWRVDRWQMPLIFVTATLCISAISTLLFKMVTDKQFLASLNKGTVWFIVGAIVLWLAFKWGEAAEDPNTKPWWWYGGPWWWR